MPSFSLKARDGQIRSITAASGLSLMEAIRRGGVYEIEAICGGSCSCATCHVFIEGGFAGELPPMAEMENDLLETSDHRRASSRLSCQIPLSPALDGMTVVIAPED